MGAVGPLRRIRLPGLRSAGQLGVGLVPPSGGVYAGVHQVLNRQKDIASAVSFYEYLEKAPCALASIVPQIAQTLLVLWPMTERSICQESEARGSSYGKRRFRGSHRSDCLCSGRASGWARRKHLVTRRKLRCHAEESEHFVRY